MKNKKLLLGLFIAVALIQLYIPAKMIFDSENILKTGTAYKFKVAPVDPNDPFRGKYISLRYKENSFQVENEKDWITQESVNVLLTTTNEGFAEILSLSKEKPSDDSNYVTATIDYVSEDNSNRVHISYPFDRYYMEELKAYDAEVAYNESLQNSEVSETYALIYVKNGEAVLDDILIDGVSIRDVVERR